MTLGMDLLDSIRMYCGDLSFRSVWSQMNLMCRVVLIDENTCQMDQVHVGKWCRIVSESDQRCKNCRQNCRVAWRLFLPVVKSIPLHQPLAKASGCGTRSTQRNHSNQGYHQAQVIDIHTVGQQQP